MKLIICGLKIRGKDNIQLAIDQTLQADHGEGDPNSQMVVGFDMVNEEDYNLKIDDFLE